VRGILLDTHALLWWLSGDSRIDSLAMLLETRPQPLVASVVSLWELQIKSQLGKIELAFPLRELVDELARTGVIGPIAFQAEHVLELDRLPTIHKDPFDRALVAQALAEGFVLASHDEQVLRYPVGNWRL